MIRRYSKMLFDFDGTLVDSRSAAIKATQQAFEEFGLQPPAAEKILDKMGIPIERSFPLMGGGAYPTSRHEELLTRFRALYAPICDSETKVFKGIPELIERPRTDAGRAIPSGTLFAYSIFGFETSARWQDQRHYLFSMQLFP